LAVSVQVPAASRLKLLPLSAQTVGVVEASETAKPALELALMAITPPPST
jgi:hypothetical protein